MTTCAHCGSTVFHRDVDPADLREVELVCARCSRVHGVTLRLGDLPDPPRPTPRHVKKCEKKCEYCGKVFGLSKKDRLTRKFCGPKCGYLGRSLYPSTPKRVTA